MTAYGGVAESKEPERFLVLEENWEACRLFTDCSGQWRLSALGELLALDYNAVDVVMRRKGYADSAELFTQLQVVEHSALKIIRDR